jgi:glycosyltransferase involved in cell wall biosynthesis
MRVVVLHPVLSEVGGAEILMVEQAGILASLGAEVSIRTAVYDAGYWATRVGGLNVEALAVEAPGERLKGPRSPSASSMRWLLGGVGDARLAIAHNYPTSAALGASETSAVKVWYCHEPPRGLYPRETSPYLAENAGRAPGRDGPRYYRTSLNSWFGGLPLIGRRRSSRLEQDRRGVATLNAVWANSEFTRDNVRRIYGTVPADVVYPTVDIQVVSGRTGAAREGLKVLSLTRLHWVKNLDTLVEGFAAFRSRHDARAELHLVGDGPLKSTLVRRVEDLGLNGSAHVHGFLGDDELAALSALCDVFACVPLDEPFGMVFPEAMTRGLLVLGPNHGGPFEILDGGKFGEVVDPLDPEAVADGFARIRSLSNADADARRTRAAASVRQRFSRQATIERMNRLLARHDVDLQG